jgi:hypothetical protein
MYGVTLSYMNIAIGINLIGVIIVQGAVACHGKVIMLQADIAVQLVARPVTHAAVLHFIRMKYLDPSAHHSFLRS